MGMVLRRSPLWVAAVALSTPTWCPAAPDKRAEPIATDRPDFTETASTVPLGMMQLEGGYTFTRNGDDKEHGLGEMLLRIATGPKTEFRIGVPSYLWTRGPGGRASGAEDASIGFKAELARGNGSGGPDIAFIGETSLPTGGSAFREDRWQPGVKLCLDWTLSEKTGLGMNLNYAYASEEGRRFDQFSGSIALGYDLTDRTGVYAELFGFAPVSRGGPDRSYVNGGFTYLVNNDFQLDARLGVGLNGASQDYFVGIGVGRRW